MVQSYLDTRENLALILFLLDIRREPNDEDLLFAEWVAAAGKKLLLVLTKVDKVSTNQRHANTQHITKPFPHIPSIRR